MYVCECMYTYMLCLRSRGFGNSLTLNRSSTTSRNEWKTCEIATYFLVISYLKLTYNTTYPHQMSVLCYIANRYLATATGCQSLVFWSWCFYPLNFSFCLIGLSISFCLGMVPVFSVNLSGWFACVKNSDYKSDLNFVMFYRCFCQSEEGERIFGEVLDTGEVARQNMHCGKYLLKDNKRVKSKRHIKKLTLLGLITINFKFLEKYNKLKWG